MTRTEIKTVWPTIIERKRKQANAKTEDARIEREKMKKKKVLVPMRESNDFIIKRAQNYKN